MDKGTEKEEIRLRSLYMPAEMAAWGDDSKKGEQSNGMVKRKSKKRDINMVRPRH